MHLRNKIKKIFSLIFFIFYFIFFLPYSILMASEEAPYKVMHKNNIYEVRHYSDRLVVQINKINDNKSFRQLFNYISGENSKAQKIEMTIPVTQIKIDNKLFMQFFLPQIFTEETVPTPNNPNIEINNIKEGYFAVIKFSGRPTDKNFEKHVQILKKKLLENKILIIGSSIRATYNRPLTPPLFRRNEVMFAIDW
jgi:hypothetical protein